MNKFTKGKSRSNNRGGNFQKRTPYYNKFEVKEEKPGINTGAAQTTPNNTGQDKPSFDLSLGSFSYLIGGESKILNPTTPALQLQSVTGTPPILGAELLTQVLQPQISVNSSQIDRSGKLAVLRPQIYYNWRSLVVQMQGTEAKLTTESNSLSILRKAVSSKLAALKTSPANGLAYQTMTGAKIGGNNASVTDAVIAIEQIKQDTLFKIATEVIMYKQFLASELTFRKKFPTIKEKISILANNMRRSRYSVPMAAAASLVSSQFFDAYEFNRYFKVVALMSTKTQGPDEPLIIPELLTYNAQLVEYSWTPLGASKPQTEKVQPGYQSITMDNFIIDALDEAGTEDLDEDKWLKKYTSQLDVICAFITGAVSTFSTTFVDNLAYNDWSAALNTNNFVRGYAIPELADNSQIGNFSFWDDVLSLTFTQVGTGSQVPAAGMAYNVPVKRTQVLPVLATSEGYSTYYPKMSGSQPAYEIGLRYDITEIVPYIYVNQGFNRIYKNEGDPLDDDSYVTVVKNQVSHSGAKTRWQIVIDGVKLAELPMKMMSELSKFLTVVAFYDNDSGHYAEYYDPNLVTTVTVTYPHHIDIISDEMASTYIDQTS